ncbi:hypothetical protein [Sphingobacterium bovistauri]|uniref:DUF2798 domain-containing protein n=1 Tax=Sphingobacterium bovistauri TaxID=2781959 RepID=A0ABS7Z881_9SPHI|nr:hypothetical protein [Sphingobacterium bovistauri]MCA5006405.1 DUF2798 domain-containing protein [Sphingobacterium bovistauri]
MSMLPVNKKENLVYTFLMVIVMAAVMTTYNVTWKEGISVESIRKAWLIFPLTFVIAFIVEWFFVSKTAFALINKLIKQNDTLPKKIFISAFCFVAQMVILMSLIGSLLFNEFNKNWFSELIITISRNFIMAYPLQILIAAPLVGFVFRKLFPLGTIVSEK